jgi:hypothetical protein
METDRFGKWSGPGKGLNPLEAFRRAEDGGSRHRVLRDGSLHQAQANAQLNELVTAAIHWLTDAAAIINSLVFRFRFRFMPLCFLCVLGIALLLLRFCEDAEARPGNRRSLARAYAKCLKRSGFLHSWGARLCSWPWLAKTIGLKLICRLIMWPAGHGRAPPEHGFYGQLPTARRARRNLPPRRNERFDQ